MEDIRVTMRNTENLTFTKILSAKMDDGFLIIKVNEKQLLCINRDDVIMIDMKTSDE